MHAQICCYGGCHDAGRHDPRRSGILCPTAVAIWMVATGSRWAVAMGRRLGSRRPLAAAWSELGLPLVPATVAICAVGQKSGRPLGVERRLGSRRHLGAPRPELGLPLAVAGFVQWAQAGQTGCGGRNVDFVVTGTERRQAESAAAGHVDPVALDADGDRSK
jgi:hypothetical protein